MYFFSENRLSQKDAKLYACLISWLGACLQVRLRLPSLRTRAAQHPHTLQTQNTHTRFKHNTAERNRTNDVGAQPPIVSSSFCFCCVVFFLFKFCVCFVFEVCVGVVPRVCEAMEAASAPAGKPPAKRLGKQIYVSISLNILVSEKIDS